MSISRALTWLAEQEPGAVAVRDDHRVLTRRELDLESNRLARAYARLGVRADDLVSIALPNGVQPYVVASAVWKLGATPAPVSPSLPAGELEALVELADPALVVGAEVAGRTCLPSGWAPPELPDAPLADAAARCWKASTSGGSTGRPKLVLAAGPATVDPTRPAAAFLPGAGAVQLVAGPVHHSTPFTYSMRGLMTGHALVVLPRFDPQRWLDAVAEHRVTWTALVPTMMHRIARVPARDGADVSSLESVLHLGAPCPPALKRTWIEWLGPERVVELYAGTEAGGLALIGGADWLAHPGSVGRGVGGSEFRVLDQAGSEVAAGTTGEVFMRRTGGATYTYRGAQARVVDGWESLGDMGFLEPGGWLHLTDRGADVVLTAGTTVYPAQVEAVLEQHPAVRSCAVVGLPDEDRGERLHAVVDVGAEDGPPARVTAAELLAWAREHLDPEAAPRSVELVRTPVRDDAGKVRRGALRAARLPRGSTGGG